MIFGKKKRIIDVSEMHRRGMIKFPKKDVDLRANKEGFVELSGNSEQTSESIPSFNSSLDSSSPIAQSSPPTQSEKSSSSFPFFGLFDKSSSSNTSSYPAPYPSVESDADSSSSFSTQQDGYNKREVDAKIEEMDNKIYKLEQRIDVLERKAGVNQPMW